MTEAVKVLRRVPAVFWDDHAERDLAAGAEIISRNARGYLLSLTPEALAELRSDADYYAFFMKEYEAEGGYGRSVCASARATVRALDKQAQS